MFSQLVLSVSAAASANRRDNSVSNMIHWRGLFLQTVTWRGRELSPVHALGTRLAGAWLSHSCAQRGGPQSFQSRFKAGSKQVCNFSAPPTQQHMFGACSSHGIAISDTWPIWRGRLHAARARAKYRIKNHISTGV